MGEPWGLSVVANPNIGNFSAAALCIPEPERRGEPMKNIFDMQHYTMNESTLEQQLVHRLITDCKHDVIYRSVSFAVSRTDDLDIKVISYLKSILGEAHASMPYDERTAFIVGAFKGSGVFIKLTIEYENEASRASLRLFSSMEAVIDIKNKLEAEFHDEILPAIKWWHVGTHGDTTRDYYLPKDNTIIRPEFYPDLGDPDKFLAEYMMSDEAVLLIAGPPGTGKTTLLRHMIHKYKLSAHVIYDERIMERDTAFQQFLFGDKRSRYNYDPEDEGGDIMIIEDADTVLESREDTGNRLMSRFLNISDGLVKLPNKKLVFTTNITDFGKVDQALLRPGRCFGVMRTRELNLTEAQAAAKVADLPIPLEKREYSLAELFNGGERQSIRRIGFGVRH